MYQKATAIQSLEDIQAAFNAGSTEAKATFQSSVSGDLPPGMAAAMGNITWFVPSGGDDRHALQELADSIASSGSGCIMWGGEILINSNHPTESCALYWPGNVALCGVNRNVSSIRVGDLVGPGQALIESPASATGAWFYFSDFEGIGNKARLLPATVGSAEDEGINIKAGSSARFERLLLREFGADAIDIDACSDIYISGSEFRDNGGNGVHCMGSGGTKAIVTGNIFSGNSIERKANAIAEAALNACACDTGKSYSLITGNVSVGDARGFRLESCSNSQVTNNIIADAGGGAGLGEGVLIAGTPSYVQISGNMISGKSGTPGVAVSVTGGSRVVVRGNMIYRASTAVLVGGTTTSCDVSENYGVSVGNGIEIAACSGPWAVKRNDMHSGSWGIRVLAGNGAVEANRITTMSEQGIDIRAAVPNVTIKQNSINAITKYGIRFNAAATDCEVSGNVCTSCTSGQIFTAGSGHKVDHFGVGSPESAVHATIGSMWRRSDGGAGTAFYIKESGTGNTGWVAK